MAATRRTTTETAFGARAAPGSLRLEQLASLIRRHVQAVLARGLHDPRLRGLISITKVEVAPDLSEAAVHVSVLPAEGGATVVHGLRHAAPRIRAEIGPAVRIRRMPRLEFRLDESLKRQATLEQALEPGATGPVEPAP
jgi:ribosome-binding factor A